MFSIFSKFISNILLNVVYIFEYTKSHYILVFIYLIPNSSW